MSLQDVVISVGTLIISFSLLATVVAEEKPALSTSLTTGTVLIIFAVTFASIPLWFTAGVNVFTATLWFILAFQRFQRRPLTPPPR